MSGDGQWPQPRVSSSHADPCERGRACGRDRDGCGPLVLPDGGPWTLPAPRLLVERLSGRFWAWLDREEFLVPKNVLDIVAAQTVTWMGLFYCPLLPLLNSIFIFLTFYIKKVQAPGLGRGAGLYLGGAHLLLLPTSPAQRHLPGPRTPRPLHAGLTPPLSLLPSTPSSRTPGCPPDDSVPPAPPSSSSWCSSWACFWPPCLWATWSAGEGCGGAGGWRAGGFSLGP